MKPLLLTAAFEPDSPFAGMIEDWEPRHRQYCERWGFDYVAYRRMPRGRADMPDIVPMGRSAFWARIDIILHHLKSGEHSHVIWLDADAVIADAGVDLRTALPSWAWLGMTLHPYPGGEDVWHFQSGVMYIRACPESIAFFEAVIAYDGVADESGYCYGNEQQAMHALLVGDAERWQRGFAILPFHWNNTVHDQPYAPIVAAFHGNDTPENRRHIMRAWAHHALRGQL